MEQMIAQLIGGAAGGIGGSKVVKDSDMGSTGNLIAGALGGLGGGQLLGGLMGSGAAEAVGDAVGGLDIGALAGSPCRRRRRRGRSAGRRGLRPEQAARLTPISRRGRP